jgi:hypothetical protein
MFIHLSKDTENKKAPLVLELAENQSFDLVLKFFLALG